jgi:hypothetical protein
MPLRHVFRISLVEIPKRHPSGPTFFFESKIKEHFFYIFSLLNSLWHVNENTVKLAFVSCETEKPFFFHYT